MSASAKAVFSRRPCVFSNAFASEAMNSAPSTNASFGHTYRYLFSCVVRFRTGEEDLDLDMLETFNKAFILGV
jgi:hypothetical protein